MNQLTFTGLDEALDYFDKEFTDSGKSLSFASLFTIVADKIDKGEVRIQPRIGS